MDSFNPGDIVFLKSEPNIYMTLELISGRGDAARCLWIYEGLLQKAWLSLDTLCKRA